MQKQPTNKQNQKRANDTVKSKYVYLVNIDENYSPIAKWYKKYVVLVESLNDKCLCKG